MKLDFKLDLQVVKQHAKLYIHGNNNESIQCLHL